MDRISLLLENLHVKWDATRKRIRVGEGFRTEIKGIMTSFLISQLRPLQAEEAKHYNHHHKVAPVKERGEVW